MKLIYNIYELSQYISYVKKENKKIGFVPTMGALHEGHLSLASKARAENDVCICSIFVNPTQFNNADDFNKYPRTLDSDIKLFKHINVDAVFIPAEKDIYPVKPTEIFELGGLDLVMEGKFRPGHFNGVATIVKKLFDLVLPDRAYFGEKDFQQLAVIKYLVKTLNIPVEIVPCPTLREANGLAMSSRNQRLSSDEKKLAPLIYRTLEAGKEKLNNQPIEEVKQWVESEISSCQQMKLEYFEIVDSETLAVAGVFESGTSYRACIAVYLGSVRLIDNIKIL